MTQVINDAFEAWIREYPEQWFCMKRRWPKLPTPAKTPPTQPAAEFEPIRQRVPEEAD
jgi:hypothetical protein